MCAVFHFSELGGRHANEDAFLVAPHPAAAGCWLCVLADGQGGQSGGGEAARLACHTAMTAAAALPPDRLLAAGAWPSLLHRADEAVRDDPGAGFTTLVGFAAGGGQLAGASCGDSAAWLVGAGRVVELTARQFKNPPVGSGHAPFVPFTARLPKPWLVLAASDGVWKYVGAERLRDMLSDRRGQELLDGLREGARLPGSGTFPDDCTAVVLQNEQASP